MHVQEIIDTTDEDGLSPELRADESGGVRGAGSHAAPCTGGGTTRRGSERADTG